MGQVEFLRGVASSTYQFGRPFPEYRRRRDLGGGVLIELAVHHFDLWRYLLGEDVDEIVAVSRSTDGDDTTATVVARMASGVMVTSVFSEHAAEQHEIEIYGDRGRIRASFYRFDGFDVVPTAPTTVIPSGGSAGSSGALGRLPGALGPPGTAGSSSSRSARCGSTSSTASSAARRGAEPRGRPAVAAGRAGRGAIGRQRPGRARDRRAATPPALSDPAGAGCLRAGDQPRHEDNGGSL